LFDYIYGLKNAARQKILDYSVDFINKKGISQGLNTTQYTLKIKEITRLFTRFYVDYNNNITIDKKSL